ncbi:MAG: XdhC family protein [Bacillota bacterium]|nr:XdhC family protein [Bacillota bacterium]
MAVYSEPALDEGKGLAVEGERVREPGSGRGPLTGTGPADSVAVYKEIARIIDEGRRAALATVIATQASSPGLPGFKMLVFPDGSALGTVGGGALEARIIREAQDALTEDAPRLVEVELAPGTQDSLGMICGGVARVYIEPIAPRPRVVVFGAGHVGAAVAHVATVAGFRAVVVDDRPEFADRERLVADEVTVSDLPDAARSVHMDSSTYVVIVTRGHAFDREVLAECLRRKPRPAYIGMIGSRSKVRATFDALLGEGLSQEDVACVHAPVGLDIGAKTAQEIAVAIVAEMIAVKNGKI